MDAAAIRVGQLEHGVGAQTPQAPGAVGDGVPLGVLAAGAPQVGWSSLPAGRLGRSERIGRSDSNRPADFRTLPPAGHLRLRRRISGSAPRASRAIVAGSGTTS